MPTDPTVPSERARQEIDYGRRGGGYIFGAFRPATGEALTQPYPSRSTANWVDFLEQVEQWIPPAATTVYGIMDNLAAHRATDVLLFALAHPRWEFVFQPKYAAYLNLIKPWWKTLRSLALKGRRFETWGRSARRLRPGPPIGTSISIPSSGASVAGTAGDSPRPSCLSIISGGAGNRHGRLGLRPCPKWHEFAGWTT